MASKRGRVGNRRKQEVNLLNVKLRTDQLKKQRKVIVTGGVSVVFAVAFILFLASRGIDWALAEFVYQNPAFAIRKIEISTDGYLNQPTLLHWADVKKGDNLMALDLGRVKRDLERYPVVKNVSLERILPDGLRIKVAERFPLARLTMVLPRGNGQYYPATFPLDPNGYVLVPLHRSHVRDPRVLNYAALPELKGFDEAELRTSGKLMNPNVLAALRLVGDFRRSSLVSTMALREIAIQETGILQVTTDRGVRVKFSPEHDFAPQMVRWRQIHDLASGAGREIALIDLSVTNNVPIKWRAARPTSSTSPASRTQPARRPVRNRVYSLNNA